MLGPNIIDATPAPRWPDPELMLVSVPAEPPTGIRRTNTGGWAAIVEGVLAGSWSGLGSKIHAITCAGTNRVL